MLINFSFFAVNQLLLAISYHVYLSFEWRYHWLNTMLRDVLLLLHHAVIVLELLCEGIMRVEIGDELLQLFHLQLQSFGSFEVFTLNRLKFALIQHIQIASNKL